MLIWTIACTLAAPSAAATPPATAPSVAVVGLGDAKATMVDKVRASEPAAVSLTKLWQRLAHTPDPREPTAESLERLLADARDREARFDNEGAAQMRAEVMRAFAHSVRPGDEMRAVAARTAHDMVAALLARGDSAKADWQAGEAVRRFADTPVDETHHPPAVVRVIRRARKRVNRTPKVELRVVADLPGTVIVDGINLGRTRQLLVAGAKQYVAAGKLPRGKYRVWWRSDDGAMSLPHHADLATGDVSLNVHATLERNIHLLPTVRLTCADPCGPQLRALGKRLSATRIIGVRAEAPGLAVDVATGAETPWPKAMVTQPPPSEPGGFSAWYVVPFGGGQFAQERPLSGTAWAVAETALLVWHLYSWQQHGDAVATNNLGNEPELRTLRNVSAGLFYGALVAGVVEAIIVGLSDDD